MLFFAAKGNELKGVFHSYYFTNEQYLSDFVKLKNSSSYYGNIYSIISYNFTGDFAKDCFATQSLSNSYVEFEFVNHRMRISHYGILTRPGLSANFLKTWKFQGMNEKNEWTTLHYKNNSNDLVGLNISKVYKTKSTTNTFKRLRIIQTGPNSDNSYHLVLNNIDFFGTLCSDKEQYCPLFGITEANFQFIIKSKVFLFVLLS